ncbi:hypothetical protein Q7C36_012809 [Tachysurus vachellii]|uniref:PHD-type domain-containing protein n=1 Tax=Tachysurus vachellii TaxID=175792 RepID=A0AA88SKQ2_TACVA|nr:hypothetical protein Q7C36_012809 [Tachysurus vachellii]
MRRNRLGKEDWVDIRWKPGKIVHTYQKDTTNCGVFVMEMAKRTVKEFPNSPQMFEIDPSQESLNKQRRDMAEVILKGSVPNTDFCSFCGNKDLPKAVAAVWIQCGTCTKWFHIKCLGMTDEQIPSGHIPWYCALCIELKQVQRP